MKFFWKAHKIFWIVFTTIILFFALLYGCLRFATPWVTSHPESVKRFLSQSLSVPTDYEQLSISWRLLGPIIRFQNLQMRTNEHEKPFLTIQKLELRFNLARNVVSFDYYPRATLVSGFALTMREEEPGKWIFNNILLPSSKHPWYESRQLKKCLRYVYSQQFFRLKNVTVNLQFFQKAPYQLNYLQLKLRKAYRNYSLDGQALLQQTAKLPIQFQATFDEQPLIDHDWNGNFHFQLAKLHLMDWLQQFSMQQDWQLQKGDGQFSFWFEFKKGALQSIASEFDANNVLVAEISKHKQVALKKAKGVVSWQRDGKKEWSVRAAPLHLLFMDGSNVPFDSELIFSKKYSQEKKNDIYELVIDKISVKNISTLLHFFVDIPDTVKNWSEQINPQGELHDIHLQLPTVNLSDIQPSAVVLSFGFSQLTTNAYKNFPALNNFQGEIVYTETKGQISFDDQNNSIYFATLFEKPIVLKDLVGSIEWQKKEQGWQIQAKNLLINDDVLQTKNDLNLFIPNDDSSPIIDLHTAFSAENLIGIYGYLPAKIMHPKLTTWLRQAIKSAQKVTGRLILKGPITHFPFDQGDGEFSVNANLQKAQFAYWPHWPQVNDLYGTLYFHNRTMQVDVNKGDISGGKIITVVANIPKMTKGETDWLSIHGQVQADISNGIQFVQKTPMLMQKLGLVFANMQGSGPIDLALDLSIPLSSLDLPIRCNGKVVFNKTQLTIEPWKLYLQQLTGDMSFTEQSVTADHLTSVLFDSPVNIKIATENPDKPQSKTVVYMDGHIVLEKLQAVFDQQFSKYVKGDTDYEAKLTVPSQSSTSFMLEIFSNLQGVTIQLPTPFAKKANEKTLFRFALTAPKVGQTTLLTLSMINKWNALLLFSNEKNIRKLDKAIVQIGRTMPTLPQEPEMVLTGYLAKLPIDEWEKFAKEFFQTNRNTNTESLPFRLDMQTDQFSFGGINIPKPRIQFETTPTSKLISIDSRLVSGSIEIPDGSGKPMDVHLKQLVLTSNESDKQSKSLTPDKVPAMRVVIDQVQYNDKNFGSVNFALSKQGRNISIDNLIVAAPFLSINAKGKWIPGETQLIGNLRITRLAQALKAWHLPPAMNSKQTDVQFSLGWNGSPTSFALAKLNGLFDLTMLNGSVEQLDPATEAKLGIGKLLSILSLQTLPRLLSLDFSSVTNKGFTFDKLTGRFQLKMGNATTDNLEVDGPTAHVAMKGRIGLAAEDYDLILRIDPHVTQGIPVVAAFAGGPIVGVTALVVNQVIGDKVVGSIASYSYTLKGSWQKPIIKESLEKAKK